MVTKGLLPLPESCAFTDSQMMAAFWTTVLTLPLPPSQRPAMGKQEVGNTRV